MTIIFYLLIGATAGFLSGLIGIGGGIIIVPCLLAVFHFLHFNSPDLMQIVVSTSFAVIAITTIYSFRSHQSSQLPYQPLFYQLLPGVVLGSICGAVIAHHINSDYLKHIFGGMMLLNAVLMIYPYRKSTHKHPSKKNLSIAGYIIGNICGMLGIGGSAFIMPYLNYYQVDLHLAVIISLGISIAISAVSLITYFITGVHAHGLPVHTIGYVYWPAWITIIIGSYLCAPLGARLSQQISVNVLRRIYAVFLLILGVNMIFY